MVFPGFSTLVHAVPGGQKAQVFTGTMIILGLAGKHPQLLSPSPSFNLVVLLTHSLPPLLH